MADPSKLHRAVLGPSQVRAGEFSSRPDANASDSPADLFDLWVHRLALINATVAATMSYRLVALPSDTQARRTLERVGAVKGIGKAARRELQAGHVDGMALPSSVTKATRYRMDDAVELERHPALDLLQQANPWTDGYGLLESTYADLQLFSEAYWFNARAAGSPPTELWRMMPEQMRPEPDPVDFVRGFMYRTSGGQDERFDTGDIVWFRRYSPDNPYRGVGELDAWRSYAKSAQRMAEFNSWLFERNGTPDHLIVTPHQVSEPDKRAFRKGWRKLFGKLYRRQETVAFLAGDVRLEQLGSNPRELEFSESNRLVRDFLCAGFGVPKALVTPEDANRAVTKEATDQHLRLTVWPMVCRVFDTINEQLLPRFGGRLLLVPDNPIRTDAATRVAERASKLASGWSVDEIRTEDGAEPLETPESTQPLVGSSLTPLDKLGVDPMARLMGGLGGPEDDADDDDDGEDGEDEQGEQDEQPEARSYRRRARPCTCVPEGAAGVISQRSLWMPQPPSPDVLERISKAAVPDDPEDVRLFMRAAAGGMAELRSLLLEAADRVTDPEDARLAMASRSEDVVRRMTEETNSALSRVVTAEGQAALNGLRPGIGLAFNTTNPQVVRYIADSAERIADTVATTFTDATVRSLRKMVRDGTNPKQAARELARTNGTQEWMARRLARTEARFASVHAREFGWEQSGVVDGKRFVLSSDPCDICEAVDAAVGEGDGGRDFPLGQSMFPNGFEVELPPAKDGRPRSYRMDYLADGAPGPPIHPNCRCQVEPIL